MKELNLVGYKHVFLAVSGVAVGAALALIIFFGFREGIDFRGGTLWQFRVSKELASVKTLERALTEAGIRDAVVAADASSGNFLARFSSTSESDHQRFLSALKAKFSSFEELGFQSIGPSIGSELRRNALIALALVLVGISLYIAFAFRKVYRPVSSWVYGVITLVTLFHDVAIPAGMLAVLGRIGNIEIDSNFVVALLVVMGFSVHDTIVVFDRIRENLFLDQGKTPFSAIVNRSVNQTLARSVNTSLTLILVLVALYFAGPATLKYFDLTLLVGVTIGIYSSIFVASPLLLVWQDRRARGAATPAPLKSR